MVALLVILTIVVALAIDSFVLARQGRSVAVEALQPVVAMKLPQPPQGVFLDSAHTLLRITSDGRLRVGIDDFLVVSVERNLGLGIMHRGELFRGADGLSPDLGDFLVHLPDVDSHLHRLIDLMAAATADDDATQRPRVADSAANGTALASRIEDATAIAGDALGFAIANLITLFAPPKLILTGAALSASHRLLTPLRAAVLRFTPASLSDVARIVVRDFSDDIWARGAAAMTLRDLYGAPWSSTGPAPRPRQLHT